MQVSVYNVMCTKYLTRYMHICEWELMTGGYRVVLF